LLEIRSQASGFPFFHRVTFHFAFIHEFRPVFFNRISARRVTYPLLRIRISRLTLNMTGWLDFIRVIQKSFGEREREREN